MIYNIHHLHCGTMCPVCAPLFGQKGFQAKVVCHCLLVETDQGLVLIDTGLGIQDYLPFSSTHLTLPPVCSVFLSVVLVFFITT